MKQPHEPILNVPAIVVATIAALVLVHAGRVFLLSAENDFAFLLEFAFTPARYAYPNEPWPGGLAADVWTFFTHALIHGDVVHLGVNIAWLLPFGSAVARRFGPARFFALFVVTSVAGAAAHLATHWGEEVFMVGASGAISGLMAAATRFAFQRGGPLHLWAQSNFEAYRVPAAPLLDSLRNIRVLAFLTVWFGLNLLFGAGTLPMPGLSGSIAWQAHIGGFFAGLLLFPLFDPVPRASDVNGNKEPQIDPLDH